MLIAALTRNVRDVGVGEDLARRDDQCRCHVARAERLLNWTNANWRIPSKMSRRIESKK